MRAVRRLETGQIVGLAVLGAAVFAVGLYLYVDHATTKARETKLAEVRAETERMQKRGGAPMLDAAAAVASQFVAHVGAGRFAEAHALLATPFKSAVSVDAFARSAAHRRCWPARAPRRSRACASRAPAAHRQLRRAACSIQRPAPCP